METSNNQNLIRINLLTWIFLVFAIFVSLQSKAQAGSKNGLLQMIEDDRTTIDAIAGCDRKIQRHIFIVAKTPELLNKIEELQERSQNQFKTIISNYDREAQSAFYDIARYPNLISDLVSNGKPSVSEADRIISGYPDDIHETANNYALKYWGVLLNIDRLNIEIDRAFKYALEPYSPQTSESVNVLIGYPEIVSALVEDKPFTKLMGETYVEDPDWIRDLVARVSQEIADRNKDDLEAYKNQIQSDPEAYNEMLEASEKFARENNEVRYLENSADPVVDVRVIRSYPYWYGYPYWYSYPYWRPRPLYYHTGFYRNHFGNIVFIGLPSFHFLSWQSHYHPKLFPHLSYNYYSYYQRHYINRYRESPRTFPHNGFHRSIEVNVINNPRVNNSALRKIDRQRGNNIVHRPNTKESGFRGRDNSIVTGRNASSGSRQVSTRSGSMNSRPAAPVNSRQRGSEVNRREYKPVKEGRSEGSYNSRGAETRSGTILKEATPQQRTSQGARPTQREMSSGRSSSVKKEASIANERKSGSSERREARTQNKQSTSRRAAHEKSPSAPSVSSDKSNNGNRSGRQK